MKAESITHTHQHGPRPCTGPGAATQPNRPWGCVCTVNPLCLPTLEGQPPSVYQKGTMEWCWELQNE